MIKLKASFFYVLLFLILVSGFGLRLSFALKPINHVIGVSVADDAYYYLEIARHIAKGDSATFDGQIKTNGFHPLYMGLCILFNLVSDPTKSLFPILLFFCFVGAANTLLISIIGLRTGGPVCGLFAGIFWAFNPQVLYREMACLETPIALTFILATTLLWLHLRNQERIIIRYWIALGLMAGLCFLTRTDTIFFLLFFALEILFTRRKSLREEILPVFLAGATALLITLPWLLWNLINFSRIGQDSGRVLLFYARNLTPQGGGVYIDHLIKQLRYALDANLAYCTGIESLWWSIAALTLFGIAGLVAALILREKQRGLFRTIPSLMFMGAATWTFYSFLFWPHKRFWYFMPFLLLMAFAFGRAVGLISESIPKYKAAFIGLLLIVLLPTWFLGGVSFEKYGFHKWQETALDVARKIHDGKVPGISTGDLLGSWNSGILGAFSGHRVVNLDGVVNPEILPVLKEKAMMKYIREKGIDHIIDHDFWFRIYQGYATESFARSMKQTAHFEIPDGGGNLFVISVQGDGQ